MIALKTLSNRSRQYPVSIHSIHAILPYVLYPRPRLYHQIGHPVDTHLEYGKPAREGLNPQNP
jgi:hypothetical protein